jgi:hypothetical protein
MNSSAEIFLQISAAKLTQAVPANTKYEEAGKENHPNG